MLHNVDMRGDVALLTRNVLISSEMQSSCPSNAETCDASDATFGAHLKVRLHGYHMIIFQITFKENLVNLLFSWVVLF